MESRPCRFTFGGNGCGYKIGNPNSGPLFGHCDKTLAACIERHGNADRFGGVGDGHHRGMYVGRAGAPLKPGQMVHLDPGEMIVPLGQLPVMGSDTIPQAFKKLEARVEQLQAAGQQRLVALMAEQVKGPGITPSFDAWRRFLLAPLRYRWLNRARDLTLRLCGAAN